MDSLPTFSHNISEILSDLMDSIGLDMETVMKKRRIYLMTEQMWTDLSTKHKVTVHHFGSQTEGTTTLGLNSDLDSLTCFNAINVVSSLKEWKKGSLNLIIETGENTAPGYCKLRCLRNDKADFESVQTVSDESHIYEGTNVYLKNTYLLKITERMCIYNSYPYIKKGPSGSGTDKIDFVTAFRYNGKKDNFLKSTHTGMRSWPSRVLREEAFSSDSFIVPVGHPRSDCESSEWRISSSMTERILMFSLNETQLKSYVITKMLKKTFFKPYVGEAVTSYHCKNALLFAIANTNDDFWKRHNLFACICVILSTLSSFYSTRFCPQFINPRVNLLEGKATHGDCLKMSDLIKVVIDNELRLLLHITFDDLGRLLAGKCSPMVHISNNIGLWWPTTYGKYLGITTIDGKAWKNWLLLHFVFVSEFTRESGSYIAKYIIELHHNGFRVFGKEPETHSNLELVEKHTKYQRKIPLLVKQRFKTIMNTEGLGITADEMGKQQERHLVLRGRKGYYVKAVSDIDMYDFDIEGLWKEFIEPQY